MSKGAQAGASLLVCAMLGLLSSAAASASHGQVDFFEAPAQLLNPSQRASALATLQHLGVRALRIELHWHDVAPAANSPQRPSFDATDPSRYSWGQYDALMADARRLRWTVLLTVTSPVPRWATAGHRDLVTRPDDLEFQQFMTAVGRHYGAMVSLWAIWNEPNIAGWLSPQFSPNGTPESPRIYRGLYEAGYAGLAAAGLSNPKVLFGETAPFGVSHANVKREGIPREVAPLAFLRGALCLNARYQKAPSCSTLKMAGYGHHPYTYPAVQGPYYRPSNRDEVPIGALARLQRALSLAARAHAIPGGVPMYLNEYGVQTRPNPLGVTPAHQAEYASISEQLAWEDTDVASFSQYLLRDEGRRGRFVGYRTGLETPSGAPKPAMGAYALPLTVTRRPGGFSLWGYVRPAFAATKVRVLIRSSPSARFRTLAVVGTDARGYWRLRSSVPGNAWKVRWVGAADSVYEGAVVKAFG
jgi:hypothetical protein